MNLDTAQSLTVSGCERTRSSCGPRRVCLDGPVAAVGAAVSGDAASAAGDSSAVPKARSSSLTSFIRSGGQRLLTPPIVAATLMLVVGGYGVFTTSQHPDEDVYVW